MRTEYEPINKIHTDKAHEAARTLIYPYVFGTDNLSFETTDLKDNDHNRILDGEMGIDRLIYVTVNNLKAPLKFTVQERFRRPHAYDEQYITITEWNNTSGLPSELYKINAGLFIYGYYDQEAKYFLDAICISVPDLLLSMSLGGIEHKPHLNKKNQSYISLSFTDLTYAGVVLWRLNEKPYTNQAISKHEQFELGIAV